MSDLQTHIAKLEGYLDRFKTSGIDSLSAPFFT